MPTDNPKSKKAFRCYSCKRSDGGCMECYCLFTQPAFNPCRQICLTRLAQGGFPSHSAHASLPGCAPIGRKYPGTIIPSLCLGAEHPVFAAAPSVAEHPVFAAAPPVAEHPVFAAAPPGHSSPPVQFRVQQASVPVSASSFSHSSDSKFRRPVTSSQASVPTAKNTISMQQRCPSCMQSLRADVRVRQYNLGQLNRTVCFDCYSRSFCPPDAFSSLQTPVASVAISAHNQVNPPEVAQPEEVRVARRRRKVRARTKDHESSSSVQHISKYFPKRRSSLGVKQ